MISTEHEDNDNSHPIWRTLSLHVVVLIGRGTDVSPNAYLMMVDVDSKNR